MPGLPRGGARTAVVAGTASAVNGRAQRRQAERLAERGARIVAQQTAAYQHQLAPPAPPAAPPPPAAAPATDVIAQLRALARLRDQGVLTEEELATRKSRVLGG